MNINTISQLKVRKGTPGARVEVYGSTVINDGGGGVYFWDANSTAAGNDDTIVQVTGVATGRWLKAVSPSQTLTPVTASPIFSDGWERASGPATGWEFIEASETWSAGISTDFSRTGTKSLRVELRNTDAEAQFGSKRCELSWNSNPSSNVNWSRLRFSLFMPRASNAFDTEPYIICQVKQGSGGVQSAGAGASPPLGFVINGDMLELHIRWATTAQPNSDANSNLVKFNLGAFEYDRWNDFEVQYNRSHTNAGSVRLWWNKLLLVDYAGPNYFESAGNPYIKIGCYRWRWAASNFGNSISTLFIGYYDNFSVV